MEAASGQRQHERRDWSFVMDSELRQAASDHFIRYGW